MTKRVLSLFAAVVAAAGLTSMASAAPATPTTITYTGAITTTLNPDNLSGTGKGVVLGVLSLDVNGQNAVPQGSNNEAGSTGVVSNGTLNFSSQAEFVPGSQIFDTQHFFARSVAQLKAAGFTDQNALGLVFQPNQSGHDPLKDSIHVMSFEALFLDKNGVLLGSAIYNSINGVDPAHPNATSPADFVGVGQGTSGYLFGLGNLGFDFYASNTNFIGMIVHTSTPFSNADDGSDNFFVTKTDSVQLVPVPAAAWTGMTALAGLGLVGKFRKKLRRD